MLYNQISFSFSFMHCVTTEIVTHTPKHQLNYDFEVKVNSRTGVHYYYYYHFPHFQALS